MCREAIHAGGSLSSHAMMFVYTFSCPAPLFINFHNEESFIVDAALCDPSGRLLACQQGALSPPPVMGVGAAPPPRLVSQGQGAA